MTRQLLPSMLLAFCACATPAEQVGVPCVLGSLECLNDGVVTCEDGAGGPTWSEPVPCPGDAPFCSSGACSSTCADECTATETICASTSAQRTCGEADSDSCREWLPAEPCSSGICAAGACQSAASVTFGFTGTAQSYVVPAGVSSIRIVASGATGGDTADVFNPGYNNAGGAGAIVDTVVIVTAGETLTVIVGGQPRTQPFDGRTGCGAGGGGGSFVVRAPDIALAVAGGGGGAHGGFSRKNGGDASITSSGGSSGSELGGSGGAGGGGGNAGGGGGISGDGAGLFMAGGHSFATGSGPGYNGLCPVAFSIGAFGGGGSGGGDANDSPIGGGGGGYSGGAGTPLPQVQSGGGGSGGLGSPVITLRGAAGVLDPRGSVVITPE